MRQQGRERGLNIIDVPADPTAILSAVRRAATSEFRRSLSGMTNPYGDGTAAQIIARVLAEVPLERLLVKEPAPLPSEATVS
jgi:UDP-N-acetylglucosamine 2-epimerase